MSRQVRQVPKDWDHPKTSDGKYIPLFDGSEHSNEVRAWDEGESKWREGLRDDFEGGWQSLDDDEKGFSFEEWAGPRPQVDDYMPEWPDAERTHLMMYEDTSEGTPISPAFETPEELARWLTDNNASSFGDMPATYDEWLCACNAGWVPSLIRDASGIRSGVQASCELYRKT